MVAGLKAVVAQVRDSDCCARLMVAQGKLRARSSGQERRALEGGSRQGRLRGNVIGNEVGAPFYKIVRQLKGPG